MTPVIRWLCGGILAVGLYASTFLLPGCGPARPDAAKASAPAPASPPFALPAHLGYDDTEPVALKTLERVPADVSRIVAANEPAGAPFFVARHPSDLANDCRQCHQEAVTLPDPAAEVQTRRSHFDINLMHGQAAALDCQTCHNYDDLSSLRGLDNRPIAFVDTYQACAQCHFQQARDWVGGAHGKRLGGWRGERVVMSCTGCHDPHQPAIPARLPVAFPTISPHAP